MTSIIKNTLQDCLADTQILNEALFVIHQGSTIEIQCCASSGARMLLPNLMMSHNLVLQTIIREARSKVVLSQNLWDQMKESFGSQSVFHPDLIIYKNLN